VLVSSERVFAFLEPDVWLSRALCLLCCCIFFTNWSIVIFSLLAVKLSGACIMTFNIFKCVARHLAQVLIKSGIYITGIGSAERM